MMDYDGVEVFSATKNQDRNVLGGQVTQWIEANRSKRRIVKTEILQSSDSEYHCLTIVIFWAWTETPVIVVNDEAPLFPLPMDATLQVVPKKKKTKA